MKNVIIMGTRPEIIKLAPLISKLPKKNTVTVFSGQHYDYEMGVKFIEQLGLRTPDYFLKLGRDCHPSLQVSQIIAKLSPVLHKIQPDNVIVQGDTNTVLASAICAVKSGVPVSHVESGLRSFDWRMPEEHNRIVTDHVSDLLFAPTNHTKQNLLSENIHGKISVTGNTIIDAIAKFYGSSKKYSQIQIPNDNYILFTLHRAENVDDKNTMYNIIKVIIDSKQKVIFPAHPRTVKRLHEFGLYSIISKTDNIILGAVGYFDMLQLMKNCSFIITDSGGIQEEATSPVIQKKVLVVRKTTDRPESVEAGMAQLVGTTHTKILRYIRRTVKDPTIPKKRSPYGNGDAAGKIVSIISKSL